MGKLFQLTFIFSEISKQYFYSSSSVVSIFCSEILELNQTRASDALMGQCHDTTILDQMKNKTRSYLMYRHVSMCEYCTYDADYIQEKYFSAQVMSWTKVVILTSSKYTTRFIRLSN